MKLRCIAVQWICSSGCHLKISKDPSPWPQLAPFRACRPATGTTGGVSESRTRHNHPLNGYKRGHVYMINPCPIAVTSHAAFIVIRRILKLSLRSPHQALTRGRQIRRAYFPFIMMTIWLKTCSTRALILDFTELNALLASDSGLFFWPFSWKKLSKPAAIRNS